MGKKFHNFASACYRFTPNIENHTKTHTVFSFVNNTNMIFYEMYRKSQKDRNVFKISFLILNGAQFATSWQKYNHIISKIIKMYNTKIKTVVSMWKVQETFSFFKLKFKKFSLFVFSKTLTCVKLKKIER